MFKMNKKASATVVLGVLLILILMGWGIGRASRECNTNDTCGANRYCGSDFKCHDIPIIKEVVVKNNLFWPSVFISFSIVGGSLILKKKRKVKKPHFKYNKETHLYEPTFDQPR